ncbi:MAG: glycoside hydrolase family 2 [Lachnospiraceae bacterium]|nr:glycoside hydrolase family 2 [Lachnospiraceae bacterium]
MSEPAKTNRNAWDVYPRPLLRRSSFFSLNGEWLLTLSREEPTAIQVPFCIESSLSGVEKKPATGAAISYKKSFRLPEGFVKSRVILHFGAVDQIARVVVNDRFYGSHEGGYTAFSFDITDAVHRDGENELIVFVEDYLDLHLLPTGKQKTKRGGMWYTPVTGIWQSVWIESVPEHYIGSLRISTDKSQVKIELLEALARGESGEGRLLRMNGRLKFNDGSHEVTVPVRGGQAEFAVENPRFWSPDDPFLYDFTLTAGADTVQSYFALRDISTAVIDGIPRILLNGKPTFFHGVLDQGYFEKGIYTPETPEEYQKDLQLLKDCGFNMLRKHIKVEPEIFYSYCDRMGIAVFQDMVNCGAYYFLRDTVLPTVSLGRNRSDRRLNREERVREGFIRAMEETVRQLKNHPSIVYWTIFNEGWGQFEGSEMYEKLRALDGSRLIDTASGWFHPRNLKTDVESRHVYFRAAKPVKADKPYVLSEFGGYAWKVPDHAFNLQQTYGYKGHHSKEELMKNLVKLYERDVIAAIPEGLSSAVYTQLSDVEDEVNGLITYDREVVKVDVETMREIAEKIYAKMPGGSPE